jgi:UDP-N-acetylmuramate dehydrogenase
MKFNDFLIDLSAIIENKNLKIDEPMSRHSTLRVGGRAKVLITPKNLEELISVVRLSKLYGIEYVVVGNGSNIIVSDDGFNGVIIKTCNIKKIKHKENIVEADCGCFLSTLSKSALQNRLTGAEFLFGIPGTVGGAVTMNAGAYGSEIKDIITEAVVLDGNSEVYKISKDDLHLSYRSSVIGSEKLVLLSAVFTLQSDNYYNIHSKMIEIHGKRKASQPLNFPNAGSIFKRINGEPVGAIIEKCGLKDFAIGGARVSNMHANFIINTGHATASDIIHLIQKVKKVVKSRTNIDLETEVKFIGNI